MPDQDGSQIWRRSLFGYISTWLVLGIGGFLLLGIASPGLSSQIFGGLLIAFGIWSLIYVAHTVTFIDGHAFRFAAVRKTTTIDAAELVSMGSTVSVRGLDLWNVFPQAVSTLKGQVLVTSQLDDMDSLRAAMTQANSAVRIT